MTPGHPRRLGQRVPLQGRARRCGILSTVAIAPLAGSNGVGDVAKELSYAQANGFSGVQMAMGTEPFVAGSLP